jgi:hypothetical protein
MVGQALSVRLCSGLFLVVIALSAACGLTVTGTGAEPPAPATDVGDTTPQDRDGAHDPQATASAFTPAPEGPGAPDGSSARDASPPGPPPPGRSLQCRSHDDCPGGDRCCFDPRARTSSCHASCTNNQVDICIYLVGPCADDLRCVPMIDPPEAEIGQCIRT